MRRHIYLIRHGETEYGTEKRYLGHTDCGLSEEGIRQARHLADIFTDSKIVINQIFSSDLIRCRDTIQTIFPDREITFLEQLREINMGIWDGLTFEEVKTRFAEDYSKRGYDLAGFIPENGESFYHCQKRAVNIFYQLLHSTVGNVVICSHAGFIRALLCRYLYMNLNDLCQIKQDYGCISIITYEDPIILVEGVNLNNFAERLPK